jgi:hypothetical protein
MAGNEPTPDRYCPPPYYYRRTAIIAREMGLGTGDSVITTADGTRWRVVSRLPSPAQMGTGERAGRHDSNFVYE